MDLSNFHIKTMSMDELVLVTGWAAKEGWNPGLHDTKSYYLADPTGFLIGYLGDEPIASISVVNYQNEFAFLGFYIVKPEFRGKGYGLKLWQAGMKHLSGINVGLDGVVAQQENYKKSGFKLAYRNIRFEGNSVKSSSTSQHVVPLRSVPFSTLEAYEAAFFPCKRSAFLKNWISEPAHTSFAFLEDGKLKGYLVIRPCCEGFKFAPLFADNQDIAQSLLEAGCHSLGNGTKIYLDVPEVNAQALRLAANNQMKACFETARMYTGSQPNIDISRVYGVTSFEIG